MPVVSITLLRIRRKRFLPAFFFHTLRSQRQLRRSDGFLGGYMAIGTRLSFWTVTAWRDLEAMRSFRRTGAHLKAMPKLLDWCNEAAVATLENADETPPTPAEAAAALAAQGRISKVRNPSVGHQAGEIWSDGLVPRAAGIIRPIRTP